MYAIRSYYDLAVLSEHSNHHTIATQVPRITSYNVCYTKLLRMHVTFHRAFDRVRDPLTALEQIIDLGCTRVLTSGLHPNVDLGKDMLRSLVDAAGDRITIMPGSGVRSGNVLELAKFTGVITSYSIHYTKLYDASAS